MKKTFTLLIALFALCAGIWATPTTITWDGTGLTGIDVYSNSGSPATSSQSLNGITVTGTTSVTNDYAGFYTYNNSTNISLSYGGTLTFRSGVYEIQSIVINYTGSGSATGWTSGEGTLTWTGSATHSVEMTNAYVTGITSIVFTVEPIPTTTVTWNADNGLTTINLIEYTNNYYNNDYHSYTGETVETIDGVTVTISAKADGSSASFSTYNENTSISVYNGATLTFSSASSQFLQIVINYGETEYGYVDSPSEWTRTETQRTVTWSGTATNSVVLEGASVDKVTSIVFTLAADAPAPASSTITWEKSDIINLGDLVCNNVDQTETANAIDGITFSITKTSAGETCKIYNQGDLWITNCGEATFTSTVGNITKIVITHSDKWNTEASTGWIHDDEAKTFTWQGTPSSAVTISGNIDFVISSIEFTVESAAAPVVPTPTPALASLTWKPENGLTSINLLEYTNYAFGGDPESTQDETSATIGGVTATISAANDGQYAQFNTSPGYGGTHFSLEGGATLTFSAASGQFERIVIYFKGGQDVSDLTDWASDYYVDPYTITWSGTPANSVVLTNVFTSEIDSIVFTIAGAASADPTPAGPNFTWQTQQINHVSLFTSSVDETQTTPVIKNIITSITRTGANDNCQFIDGQIDMHNNGTMTFQSIVGDITGIVINCNVLYYNTATNLPDDWTYNSLAGTLTWSGTAAESVTLSGTLNLTLSSIQFLYTPADAPYLGDEFYGYNYHKFKVTGPKTVSMPSQYLGGSLLIPSTVEYMGDTYYVTEIEDYAFSGLVELSNVLSVGNDGGKHLAKIGAHAFDGCIRMDEVSLNSTVLDTIGDAAFKNCKLMTIFELWTEEPPVLGTDAFYGDTYLNHINVETYSVDAYQVATGWSAYASMIAAMYSLPSVGEQFFFHNQMTTGIYQVTYASNTRKEAKVLPYNAEVNAIYPTTFEGTLVIPEEADYIHNSYSVTGIGANAYKDSTRFNMVLLPLGVKTIESGAFLNCTGVEKVFFLWDDPTAVTWADATVGAEFKTAASHGTQIFVPQGRLAEYQAWAPAWADCMFEGELFDVTASQDPNNNLRHYCTFYDSTTDYMLPPSVWANVGVVTGGEFRIWPIKFDGEILPRGTAVVLESETPTYRLIPTGNTEPLYTGPNDLEGLDVTTAASAVAEAHGVTTNNIYVLGKQAQMNEQLVMGMGMYRYTGANLGAHKAYMIYDGPGSGSSGQQNAPARFLFRHEQTPTGVENVQENKAQCNKLLRNGQLIIIKDGKEYNAQGIIIK